MAGNGHGMVNPTGSKTKRIANRFRIDVRVGRMRCSATNPLDE